MVEIMLEAADAGTASAKDLYVAVRIGDVQKFTRMSGGGRKFVFPEKCLSSRSYGKLEVFRHVGSCTFGTAASLMNSGQELSMSSGRDMNDFTFRVTSGSPLTESVAALEAEVAAAGRSEAQEYLDKNQLEVRLADVMQSLLRERPADPVAFISEHLQRNQHSIKQSAATHIKDRSEFCRPSFLSLPPAAWVALHARFPRCSSFSPTCRCKVSPGAPWNRSGARFFQGEGLDEVRPQCLAEMRAALRSGLHVVGKALAYIPQDDITRHAATSLEAAAAHDFNNPNAGAQEAQTALQAASGDGRLMAFLQSLPTARASPCGMSSPSVAEVATVAVSLKRGLRRGWSAWGMRSPRSSLNLCGLVDMPLAVDTELSKRNVCSALNAAAKDGSLAQLLIMVEKTELKPSQ